MNLSPFYFQDRIIIFSGTYDLPANQLIDMLLKPGMICMDIGANIGHMALHMARKVGPSGKIFAFEPVPDLFERLVENIARNAFGKVISAFELALSDQSGTAILGFANSLTENQGMGSLVNIENEVISLKKQVRTETIDEFVQWMSLTRLDFLKVDIQGAEILLLEGGHEVFSSLSPEMVIEFSSSDLYCFNKSPLDLARILMDYKYRLYQIEKNGQVGSRVDINYFFLNSNFLLENLFCTKK